MYSDKFVATLGYEAETLLEILIADQSTVNVFCLLACLLLRIEEKRPYLLPIYFLSKRKEFPTA